MSLKQKINFKNCYFQIDFVVSMDVPEYFNLWCLWTSQEETCRPNFLVEESTFQNMKGTSSDKTHSCQA